MTTQDSQSSASPDPSAGSGSPSEPATGTATGRERDHTTPDPSALEGLAGSTAEGGTTTGKDTAPTGTEPGTDTGSTTTDETSQTAAGDQQLVPQDAVMDFKARWEAIQQGFVDDPRSAVSDADALVGDVLQKLSTTFQEQHRQLEAQWSDGEPDTEDLRSALQRYRDFFDRLLTI